MTDLATWHPWKRPGDTPPDRDCRILITFMWRGAMWTDAGRYLAGRFMASDGTLIPESDILGWSDRPLYGAPAQ